MTAIDIGEPSLSTSEVDDEDGHTGQAHVGRRAVLVGLLGLTAAACKPFRPTPTPNPTATPTATTPTMTPTPTGTPTGTPTPTPTTPTATTPTTTPPTTTPPPPPTPGNLPTVLSSDQAMHVLRRATFGLTPAVVEEIGSLGIEGWLDRQLDPASIDDAALDDLLQRFSAMNWTAKQINETLAENNGEYVADLHLVEATIVRNIYSNRQLFEKVVEFWTNHFSIGIPSDDSWGRKTVEDREVIRALALTSFTELLIADAKSPAMLRYLNNEDSRGDNTNENYGREVLELHTLSVDGGYTEDDVKNCAKALTGFTIDQDTKTFEYRSDYHYVGPLKVLDWESANGTEEGGLEVGESLLTYLSTHPSTARHIATKLARQFVSDVPPESLVSSLAQVFLDNGTQIKPMIRALFLSTEFQANIGQKVRRPLDSLTAAMRVLNFQPESELLASGNDRPLNYAANAFSQAPMGWRPPNGYPDTMGYWLSSARFAATWNRNNDLVYGGFDGHVSDPDQVFDDLLEVSTPITTGALLDQLVARLLFQEITPAERAALLEATDQPEDTELTDQSQVRGRLQNYARAIFDSPHFLQR